MAINHVLFPIKGHYFFFNAGIKIFICILFFQSIIKTIYIINTVGFVSAMAPIIPFLSIYAKQLGFGSFVVGVLYTILPFTGMLMKPIAGALADKFHCQKKIFLAAGTITIIGFLGIYFIPKIPAKQLIMFKCDKESVLDTCVDEKKVSKFDFEKNSVTECEVIIKLVNIGMI